LVSQVRREQVIAEHSHGETLRLRQLLDECDSARQQHLVALEAKERECQSLRSMVKRLANVITSHRESFGEIADLNYDLMLRDVSNVNLQYQAPSVTQAQYLSQLLASTQRAPPEVPQFENPYQPPVLSRPQEDYQSIMDKYNRHFHQPPPPQHR